MNAVDSISTPEDLARSWAASGRHAQLQSSVAHRRGVRILALYMALAAVVTLAGHLWPIQSICLLVLIVISALVDMDGGRGWVRGLSIADATHNVLAWPHPRQAGPTLVIAAPLENALPTRQVSTVVLSLPLGIAALGAIGIVLAPFWPDFGTPLIVGTAGAMMLGACMSVGLGAVTGRGGEPNPARATLEQVMTLLERNPISNLQCVFALIGGGASLHDGIEVLLKNHETDLPPGQTRVLVIHPHSNTLGLVPLEGRVRQKEADRLLVDLLREQGCSSRSVTTAACRAMRLGWPAAAMTVSNEQINAGATAIARLATSIDADLAESGD